MGRGSRDAPPGGGESGRQFGGQSGERRRRGQSTAPCSQSVAPGTVVARCSRPGVLSASAGDVPAQLFPCRCWPGPRRRRPLSCSLAVQPGSLAPASTTTDRGPMWPNDGQRTCQASAYVSALVDRSPACPCRCVLSKSGHRSTYSHAWKLLP